MAIRRSEGEGSDESGDRGGAGEHSSAVAGGEPARQTARPHPRGRGSDAPGAAAVDQDIRGHIQGAAQAKNVREFYMDKKKYGSIRSR